MRPTNTSSTIRTLAILFFQAHPEAYKESVHALSFWGLNEGLMTEREYAFTLRNVPDEDLHGEVWRNVH